MKKKTVSITNFILRHFVASVVSIAVPVALVIITYCVLFIVAIITDTGLGGPVALPFWAVIILAISFLYTAILLFPSTLFAEAIARVFGKWQHIAQIPISTLILLLLVHALSLMIRRHPDYSEMNILHWANYPLVVFLILTIPLGIYWWTMKFIQAGFSVPTILFRKLRQPISSKNGGEQT
jgi:hypothetical protein